MLREAVEKRHGEKMAFGSCARRESLEEKWPQKAYVRWIKAIFTPSHFYSLTKGLVRSRFYSRVSSREARSSATNGRESRGTRDRLRAQSRGAKDMEPEAKINCNTCHTPLTWDDLWACWGDGTLTTRSTPRTIRRATL
jgi:hypothetical protein